MKKLLAILTLFLAYFSTLSVAQEQKQPYCAPFLKMNNDLVQMGFVPTYMSTDEDMKMGSRFYINAEQKAIAVLVIDLTENVSPKACLATIQGNLVVKKEILEHIHRQLVGEKA